MNDIIEINRFIKKSQCYIKELDNGKYLLYDDYNEYNIKGYENLDLNIILSDIKIHLALKIQDNLIENTIEKLKMFFKNKYNISIEFKNHDIILIMKGGDEQSIKLKEFESMNIKCLKLGIIDKLGLI